MQSHQGGSAAPPGPCCFAAGAIGVRCPCDNEASRGFIVLLATVGAPGERPRGETAVGVVNSAAGGLCNDCNARSKMR